MTDIADLKRKGRRLQSKQLRRDEKRNGSVQLAKRTEGSRRKDLLTHKDRITYGEYELSVQRAAFVMHYVMDPTSGKHAAIKAGYSPKSATAQASFLLRESNVKAAIEDMQSRLAENTELTMERVINEVAGIAFADTTDDPKTADKLRALEMLSKFLGFDTADFNGRVEIVVSYEDGHTVPALDITDVEFEEVTDD